MCGAREIRHCQNSNSCASGIAAPRESGKSLSSNACHFSDKVGGAGGRRKEDVDTTVCHVANSTYEDLLRQKFVTVFGALLLNHDGGADSDIHLLLWKVIVL